MTLILNKEVTTGFHYLSYLSSLQGSAAEGLHLLSL